MERKTSLFYVHITGK